MTSDDRHTVDGAVFQLAHDMGEVKTALATITAHSGNVLDIVKELKSDLKEQRASLIETRDKVAGLNARVTALEAHDRDEMQRLEAVEDAIRNPDEARYFGHVEVEHIRRFMATRGTWRRHLLGYGPGALLALFAGIDLYLKYFHH